LSLSYVVVIGVLFVKKAVGWLFWPRLKPEASTAESGVLEEGSELTAPCLPARRSGGEL